MHRLHTVQGTLTAAQNLRSTRDHALKSEAAASDDTANLALYTSTRWGQSRGPHWPPPQELSLSRTPGLYARMAWASYRRNPP